MHHILVNPEVANDSPPVDRAAIELTRDLPARFPGAGLRPVALVRAHSLDRLADPSGRTGVVLALENLQISGSFKVRGALCALQAAKRAGMSGVVAASAGNHGIGISRAARLLDLQATVVVPDSAPDAKTARIVLHGAEVVRVEGGYDAAEHAARALASEREVPFVSPYDDLEVLTGNGSSLALELSASLGRVPEHVIVPIGGGGLATGMAWGLSTEAGDDPRTSRRVWGVQSEASPAFALSLERGSAVERLEPMGPTLAEGLEGGISPQAFRRACSVVAGVSVVAERRIAAVMNWLRVRLGLRVEGSAAAALVPALDGLPARIRGGCVVVVLTGRNADPSTFEAAAAMGDWPAAALEVETIDRGA